MGENEYKFSIILEELDKLSKEPENRITTDEIKECEEIRVLREIVLDMQTPAQNYFTST
jgi:hypothetical protein